MYCKTCKKDVDPVRDAWKACAPLGALFGGGLASLAGDTAGEKAAAALAGMILVGGGAAALAYAAERGHCPHCRQIVDVLESAARIVSPVTA